MATSSEPVAAEYIAGVFDTSGGIDISVAKADRSIGFRFTPSLRISAPKYKTFFGMLDEFCEEHDVEYKLQPRDDDLVQWRVSKCNSIKNFLEAVGPHLVYLSRKSDFVLNELLPAKENNATGSPQEFYRLAYSLEQNDSRRAENDHIKYGTDFLKEQWNVPENPEVRVYSFNSPNSLSDEFTAGVIDGGARLTPLVQQDESKAVGYSLTATLVIAKCHNQSPFFKLLEEKLDDFNADPSHIQQEHKESIRITRAENIKHVANPLHNHLVLKYIALQEFLEELAPVLQNGEYHEDELMFLHALRKMHAIRMPCSKGRNPKYTPAYFCSKFGIPEEKVFENPLS